MKFAIFDVPEAAGGIEDRLKVAEEANLTTVEKPDEPLQVVFYVTTEKMMEKEPKPREPEVPQILS